MPNIRNISESNEDYLEAIYLLGKEHGTVKVKDIAFELGISLPSVSEKLRVLEGKGLVKCEKYGPVELSSRGRNVARKVYSNHKLLADFFVLLGVDRKTALEDACNAEHVLSKKSLEKVKEFMGKKGLEK